MDVALYDTTLRDGAQREGISLTVEEKVRVARLLDEFGIAYVEGGWPGSNPKDAEFFHRMRQTPLRKARLVAFGATRRPSAKVEDDPNLRALIEAETPTVALVGKASAFHAYRVLETTPQHNVAMVSESIRWLKGLGREVVFDAEHFFDGYRDDPNYAMAVIEAAEEAGADWIVLCDTNGGSLPSTVSKVVRRARRALRRRIGIHTHNDGDLAVANALAAVEAGCMQVQGTVNGYGERCGNANLVSLLAALQIKMGMRCVPGESLARLTELSRTVSEIVNLAPDPHAPYVGASAFAHKGGIHVAAVEKVHASYEHVEPERVGNRRRVVVSELSGRGNIRARASELGIAVAGREEEALARVKELERLGFQFEAADGSLELLLRRCDEEYRPPFELLDVMVMTERRGEGGMLAEATVKMRVEDDVFHTAAAGSGPVHALDAALRKALLPIHPSLSEVRLCGYSVRILDPSEATAAVTRVLVQAGRGNERWTTVGCSRNIVEASSQALADSLELPLARRQRA